MMTAHARVAVKRVYEESTDSDGTRVLVDRLWPRGLTKDKARIDRWLRELAPSNELRKWFHAHSEERAEFRKRYLGELKAPSAVKAFEQLHELLCTRSQVTLLFASKNAESNNATVLKELIEGKSLKPRKAATEGRGSWADPGNS
jgi:uncharacterized protein YeaO (DUF488 family)